MPKRDAVATKERLLKSGLAEFGNKGYGGARTAKIAQRARCNIRLLYYYFGGKEGLYLACLERVYTEIRDRERDLNLEKVEPREAVAGVSAQASISPAAQCRRRQNETGRSRFQDKWRFRPNRISPKLPPRGSYKKSGWSSGILFAPSGRPFVSSESFRQNHSVTPVLFDRAPNSYPLVTILPQTFMPTRLQQYR